MKTLEQKTILMNILGGMDSYIRNHGDETITECWLMGGLPDGCDEDELAEIADDLDQVRDIVRCFARRLDNILEDMEK